MTNSSSLEYWQSAAAVVESSNDAIICTDLNGTIATWNKAAKTIFGYRPEEVIGQPVYLLAAPGREDEMPIILDQVRRGGGGKQLQKGGGRQGGRPRGHLLTTPP